MGKKFDIGKIKERSNGALDSVDNGETGLDVGVGLLNNSSKTLKTTMYIRYEDLVVNEKNTISKDGIAELASLIDAAGGLEQPLVVYKIEGGKYKILTGERRYLAVGLLIEQGKWNEDHLVEVKIRDLDAWDIELDNEDKEYFAILMTNQYRDKTDADKYHEAIIWKRLIRKLRENGRAISVVGYDESGDPIKREKIQIGVDPDGNPITKDITGMKTQQVVANMMNVSPAQVAKIDKIANQGSEALKAALKDEKVNISVGAKIASMPTEEQEKFIEESLEKKGEGESITEDDFRINAHKDKLKSTEKEIGLKEELPGTLITEKQLKMDLKKVSKRLKESGGVRLEEKDYAAYVRQIELLNKIFAV